MRDNPEGRALLQAHFSRVVGDPSNIVQSYSNQYGSYVVRESLFMGPSGMLKFESTWEVMGNGSSRFVSGIPFGVRDYGVIAI